MSDAGQQPVEKYGAMVYMTKDFPVGTRWNLTDGSVLKQVVYKPDSSNFPGFIMLKGNTKTWCEGGGRWAVRWNFWWAVNFVLKIVLPDGTEIVPEKPEVK